MSLHQHKESLTHLHSLIVKELALLDHSRALSVDFRPSKKDNVMTPTRTRCSIHAKLSARKLESLSSTKERFYKPSDRPVQLSIKQGSKEHNSKPLRKNVPNKPPKQSVKFQSAKLAKENKQHSSNALDDTIDQSCSLLPSEYAEKCRRLET